MDPTVADGERDRSEKREVEGVASWCRADRPEVYGANGREVPAVVRVVAVATEKTGNGRRPGPLALRSHLLQGRLETVALVESSPVDSHVREGSRKKSHSGAGRRSEQHERRCRDRAEGVYAKITDVATCR